MKPCCCYHGDVVAVEEDLIQFGYPPSLWCDFKFCHILQHHVDKVIKAQRRADNFFVGFHDDVNWRADTFVRQLK